MRLGILGGTFDPVHYGHLLAAEQCREACGLDRVWFVPAAIAPHKAQVAASPAADRIEMLRLAIGGQESFEVSTIETDRGNVSYTIDTLAAVRAAQPDAELFLILGGDSLVDFPTWKDPAGICRLATLVAVGRPGVELPDAKQIAAQLPAEAAPHIRLVVVPTPRVEISSSEIRLRVAQGRSIRYQTPRAVEEYIRAHGLYCDQKNEPGLSVPEAGRDGLHFSVDSASGSTVTAITIGAVRSGPLTSSMRSMVSVRFGCTDR
jgi:nicotinate-nucleotide adenylyltransferase